ncbi:MAG: hypothetical protein IT236_01205 [Bacteroidia bacterium]|nr:hypothetical protein [Bacteroidia bacterium]
MKKLSVLFALIFMLVVGNKAMAQENKGPQPTKDTIVYKGVFDLSCALEIQFGSYSAGIDGKTYDKIIALIESKKLKYTSKNIGREGETRLCLPLTELSNRQKKKFIEQLKKTARKGYLTSISIR